MSDTTFKLTPARRRVLELLVDHRVYPSAACILGFRRKTLDDLWFAGLAKFRPYAQQPHYVITDAGRAALENKSH